MEFLGLGIAAIVAAWVYSDAKERNCTIPYGWALGVFIGLIIFLPLYLIMRPKKPVRIEQSLPLEDEAIKPKRRSLCSQCGTPFSDNPNFCSHCGYKLSDSAYSNIPHHRLTSF
ncbi:MAG: hypothetical protein E6713_17325 [Sporomusaceae bacterium]|nr:hypothetical protein [Sporomusaceae bacterium]